MREDKSLLISYLEQQKMDDSLIHDVARTLGISVLGIFAGNYEDTAAEKRIFGKDFAYIRDIRNFSRVAGAYLRRQLEEE